MEKLLIIIDMQNDFIHGSLGSKEARDIIPKIVDKIKNWDGVIIATQDTHDEDYNATREGRKLPVKHCMKNSKGWRVAKDIYKLLLENDNAYLYEKHFFAEYEFVEAIEQWFGRKFDYVEFVGVCTDICVISNALLFQAFWEESELVVDAKCCAGTTPAMHKKALDVLKSCQIEVKNYD